MHCRFIEGCFPAGACLALVCCATPAQAGQEATGASALAIAAPVEWRGEWRRAPQPFVHPIMTSNWFNVRITALDAQRGTVSGRFDFYVRSLCYDLVDEPFSGTFDGYRLTFRFDYTLCPGMAPLVVSLWNDAGKIRGRANQTPLLIQRVVALPGTP